MDTSMQKKQKDKLDLAIRDTEKAISLYDKHKSSPNDERIYFMLLAKSFEVLLEYSWKKLKAVIESEGLEALTPKEIFKVAASVKLIKDPKFWIDAINARNLSVHDYYSIPNAKYYELASKCVVEARKIAKIKE